VLEVVEIKIAPCVRRIPLLIGLLDHEAFWTAADLGAKL